MKAVFRTFCEKWVFVWSRLLYVLLVHSPIRTYQPIHGQDEHGRQTTRVCQDRWSSIQPHLGSGQSVLDVGCNIGYFSFKAAEAGNVAFGLDFDILYIATCRIIRESTGETGAQFLRQRIDLEYIERMPRFDAVFNFSVFHHWVKLYGEQHSRDMMRGLADKCRVMFFETGQSNEVNTSWSDKIEFMGPDPRAWTIRFLKEIGFSSVDVIGTYPSGLTDVDRYLYLARK